MMGIWLVGDPNGNLLIDWFRMPEIQAGLESG